MLEPQVNYKDFSPLYHQWPKLSLSSKLSVSVMCGKFQMISMHYGDM